MTPDARDNPSPSGGGQPGQPGPPAPPGAPGPADSSGPGGGGDRPPHSRLAWAALALALVPCCPAVPLAGSMLGLLAHARIRRAGGRMRGERMALAAMLLGSVLALVQMLLLEQYLEEQAATQRSRAVTAVQASLDEGAAGWPQAALDHWADTAAMDAARLRQGVAALESELGSFVGIRLAGVRAAGPGLSLGRVWTGFISTGGADRPAVVEAVATQTPRAGAFGLLPKPGVRLRAIRVILADGREIVIGTPFGQGPGESDGGTGAEPAEPADAADAADAAAAADATDDADASGGPANPDTSRPRETDGGSESSGG